MKILIVTQYFWPENFRINDLAVEFKKKGHDITVLTGIPNYPEGYFYSGYSPFKKRVEEFQGVKIYRVPLISRGNSKGLRLILNYFSFALSASIMGPLYCRADYDLIFVFEPSPITVGVPAVFMKRFKKVPIVFWVLDLWPETLSATGAVKSKRMLHIVRNLVKFIYRNCDTILVSSRGFIKGVRSLTDDMKKVLYFPNWAEDLNSLAKGYAQENSFKLPDMPKGFRIMFAGNIGEAQNFETILSAAEKVKQFKEIHWLILGDGRKAEWVKEQIKSRGLTDNVHLLGKYPLETMTSFFSQADALLVTLKGDPLFSLTVPGKVQAYLSCGKPIIAALDGEGAELIKESGAGLVCPAEDSNGLSETALTLYNMPKNQRERMGRCGEEYTEVNFDRTMLFDKLERWMQDLLPN